VQAVASCSPEGKVLALIGVVEDVGADRGVLISAAGFQSGAIKAAEKRNVTLTTLNGLRETVREELNSSVAQALETKVIKLKDAFSALSTYEHPRPGYHVSKPRPGVDHHAHGQAYGMLALLELGFERLRLGKPAPFPLPIKTGGRWGKGKTSTAEEFMTKASEAVVILEAMLAEQHRLMRFASG